MLTKLEQDILEIIKAHRGEENKITQYEITNRHNQIYSLCQSMDVGCRQVRNVIEGLINQGYPIVSTPSNGGGYFWQEKPEEGLECSKRIRRQAVKLFLKARKIRSNSRTGQLELDVRI